jgi:hypothetical protein
MRLPTTVPQRRYTHEEYSCQHATKCGCRRTRVHQTSPRAALRGDRIQARQFQVALEVLRTTYEMSELLDTSPDYKGNFYRALTNDRCDDRHGMLDPEMLADLCPLDNGRHNNGEHAFRPRIFSLGSLNILPVDILEDILVERLDLATLMILRRVISRSLRCSFDELP